MEKYPLSILIAEDDPPSRLIVTTIVKQLFDKVFVAENGKEALDLFIENRPDIVLSDIGMPFLDGLSMSKKIREINPKVPIILATAFDNKDLLLNAIEIGINNYVVKPINRDKIIEILNKIATSIIIEQEFKKQEERIKLLFTAIEHSSGLVIILDKQGNLSYFNPKLLELSLYDRNYYNNSNVEKLFTGENFDVFLNAIKEQIDWRGELKLINNSQKEIYLNVSLSPIYNLNGEIISFVIVADDITEKKIYERQLKDYNELLEQKVKERTIELENTNKKLLEEIEIRKKTEEELIKARDLAEEANRAKSLFLAKVTHELRTPMNGILGMTSVLLDSKLDEKQRRNLMIVKQSGESLLNIINDILDWSKIETGKLQLDKVKYNLKDVLNNVYELLNQSAVNKGIELNLRISSDLPEIVYGDPNRLQQVLVNLVSNGIKFTDKGSVEISTKTIEKKGNIISIRFEVKDTGIGIPEDKLDKLFKSFSQIDDNLTRKFGGTGLGLYISKELVEMMGGKIFCESKVGVGSTFYFIVPLELPDDETIIKKSETSLSELTANYPELCIKILIVEDSFINQEVIREVLSSKNCNFKIANNGREALEIIQSEKFDVILMDLQMPEMDGYEATRLIAEFEKKNNLEHTPVIALTAHNDEETINSLKINGFDDLITKPFDWENFFQILYKYNKSKSSKTVDLTKLRNSINNNEKLLRKLIVYFINKVPEQVKELENAIRENDFIKIDRISHKLKSEIGNFGAEKAFEVISKINQASRREDNDKFDILLLQFKDELEILLQYLKKIIENNDIN